MSTHTNDAPRALDLSSQAGDAVVGATLTLCEASYRVDAAPDGLVGAPYRLTNVRTGISFLDAHFWRDGEPAAPAPWSLAVPGGRVGLSLHRGPFEPERPWSSTFMDAYRARARGDLVGAERAIQEVLAQHPAHVLALNFLGGLAAARGDMAAAFTFAGEVVRHEPMHPGFAFNYLQTLGGRAPGLALVRFRALRPWLPLSPELAELGARLHLNLGEPAEALRLLDLSSDEARAALAAPTHAACEAKARAAPLVEEATARLDRGEELTVLELLQEARALFPSAPYTTANLGLACARAGRHADAAALLLSAAERLPPPAQPLCVANAAFALVDAGDAPRAAAILDAGLAHLLALPEDPGSLLADLPFVAVWLRPPWASKESLPREALRRFEAIAEALGDGTPPTVTALLARYRTADHAERQRRAAPRDHA